MGDLLYLPNARRPAVPARRPSRVRSAAMLAVELAAVAIGSAVTLASVVLIAGVTIISPPIGLVLIGLAVLTRPRRRR